MGRPRTVHALKQWKGEIIADRIMRPVGGLEAEFSVVVDGQLARPEDLFGDPRGFISEPLIHRTGRSFQLPNGAAVYFDTGVIEVATPVMELERGCFGRLARSLDEAVSYARRHLDDWEARRGRHIKLQGFSTHYNVSVGGPGTNAPSTHVKDLAWLLVHILPAPVMLLATNRRSTGVGVRPRPRRIEVTSDYPPDPVRLAATGAVIAGIVQAANRWRNLDVGALERRGIPVLAGFTPVKHTSRRGWLARFDCYPLNPFACDAGAPVWMTRRGPISLRSLAHRILEVFDRPIRDLADAHSYTLARRIMTGDVSSWLDDADRPLAYEDVGRATPPPGVLKRLGLSRYERVVLNALERRSLTIGNERFTPVGMRGWSRVVFRRDSDGSRTVLPLDTLVKQLGDWEELRTKN